MTGVMPVNSATSAGMATPGSRNENVSSTLNTWPPALKVNLIIPSSMISSLVGLRPVVSMSRMMPTLVGVPSSALNSVFLDSLRSTR